MRKMKPPSEQSDKCLPGEELESVSCDLCGKKNSNIHESEWNKDSHQTLDTRIEMRNGQWNKDDGYCEETRYHLCSDCFKNKLMKWFKDQGVAETRVKYEW